MEKNKKILTIIGILVITGILLINNILAFAVSSQYGRDNPLQIYPGETKNIVIMLQNLAGTENIMADGKIIQDIELAKIIDSNTTYIIPKGAKSAVNIQIKIPKDVEVGSSYNVTTSFTTITGASSGNFGFGSGIEHRIPITIIGKPKSPLMQNIEKNQWLVYIIALITLIIIVSIIIKRVKSSKKRR